jgi:hypothetical protein
MSPTAPITPLVVLDRCLRVWLGAGLLLLVLLPDARSADPLVGFLPFWLAGWPALSLLLLHRYRLGALLRRRPVPATLRRIRTRQQALRAHRPVRVPLARALLAALRSH